MMSVYAVQMSSGENMIVKPFDVLLLHHLICTALLDNISAFKYLKRIRKINPAASVPQGKQIYKPNPYVIYFCTVFMQFTWNSNADLVSSNAVHIC